MVTMDELYARMAPDARHVMALALDEALRFNHNYIGTEHLLLGLLRSNKGQASRAFMSMGVTLVKARSATEFIIGRGEPSAVIGIQMGLTPRAKFALSFAVTEGMSQRHSRVQSEDILLGLLREGEGIAIGILESLGANLNRVREAVIESDSSQGTNEPTAELVIEDDINHTLLLKLLDLSEEDFAQVPETFEHARLKRYGILSQTLTNK